MREIPLEELKPGMTLARTILNKNMIVILSENTFLTKAHITRLEFLDIPCAFVKDEYELSASYQGIEAMLSRSNSFVVEYKDVLNTAREIFDAAAIEGGLPMEKANTMVQHSILPLIRHSGILDYLYDLNHLANDVYNHSLRVSILAGVIAKWMHCDGAKVQDVVLAGFLHDIGKTRFTPRLLEKLPQNLKGKDLDAYMQHTTDGHHILSQKNELSDGVKLSALQHHECMDGTGFPFNSEGKDIHAYARIIAVADIYDNITTEREGLLKETPFTAIAQISRDMFSKLDPTVCVPFLTNIQEIFIGSSVVLSDGRRGRIIQYPHDFSALPLIEIDKDHIIDLNKKKDLRITEYNPK